MKNTFTIFAAALSVMAAGSCDSTVTPGEPDLTAREIVLSTSITAAGVKAAYPQTNTQLIAGETVNVWVDENTGGTVVPLYENFILTANGYGGLSGGAAMYYPQNDHTVDIYAVHTNAALADRQFPTGRLTHSVSASQRNLDSYVWSDLLLASARNIPNDSEEVQLVFRHLLSKVQVALVLEDGLGASDIVGIMIRNTRLKAGFSLNKSGSASSTDITPEGETADIWIGTDISPDFNAPAYNDAVIVPQILGAGSAFVVVELADGTRLAYTLKQDTSFESGYCYQYHITLTRDEISVTSQVIDWVPGGSVSGEADIVVD